MTVDNLTHIIKDVVTVQRSLECAGLAIKWQVGRIFEGIIKLNTRNIYELALAYVFGACGRIP